MNALTMRFGATAVKRALLLGVIGALLSGFMVAQAVTSTNLGTTTVSLAAQTFADDTAVTIASLGISVIGANDAVAVGDTSPGVAITSALPEVTTAVTKNNYAYKFEVKEPAGGSTLTATEKYKIDLYGDDGTTTTLLATFYMEQASPEAGVVEGVTATVDVGTDVHASYDIVVTLQ